MDKLLSGLFCVLIVVGLPETVFSETLVVGQGGRFREIQPAIEAAQSGDVIVIRSGTYTQAEPLYIDRKNGLEIRGEGQVVIACSEYEPVIYITRSKRILISNIHGVHQVKDPSVGKGMCGPGATIITAEACNGIVIQECELNGCGQTGFEGLGSDRIVLNGNYIHDNVHSAIELKVNTTGTMPDIMISNNRIEDNFGPVIISMQEGVLAMYDRDTDEHPGIILMGNTWKNNDRMPRRNMTVGGRPFVFWGPPDGYEDGKGNEIIYEGVLDADTMVLSGDREIILQGRTVVGFYRTGELRTGFAAENQSVTSAAGAEILLPSGTRLEFLESGGLSFAERPDGAVIEFEK
jgi:hypothetical protein